MKKKTTQKPAARGGVSSASKPEAPVRPKRERPKQSPIAAKLQEASLRAALSALVESRPEEDDRPSFTFPGIPHLKKRAFLAAFAECGNVRMAAETAKIDRKTHSNWMRDDPIYAEAFEAARNHAMDLLEQEAWRRARSGVMEPIYQQGMLCGTVKKYSDTLLIFLLKGGRKDVYADRHEHTGKDGADLFAAADQRLAGFLAEIAAARDADAPAGKTQ